MTIKNDITAHIDTSLAAMATGSDYNFDYSASNINVFDPSDRAYPQIMSTYTANTSEDVIMSNKYTSTINALFTVTVDNSADVDLLLSKVLSDVQRMFDDQHTTLREKGMIKELHAGVDDEYKLNKLRPGKTAIRWDIRYRVSMDDPSST